MSDHHYYRLPLTSCSLSPPTPQLPLSPISLEVPPNRLRRVWLEALKYLRSREILDLSRTCKLFYSLSYEPELWHEVCQYQVPDFLLHSLASELYRSISPVFRQPYAELNEMMRVNLPANSEYVTEELELTLMKELEEIVPQTEETSEVSSLRPLDYRRVALEGLTLECGGCKQYKRNSVKCPVLDRFLCIQCRSRPKYRMLSLSGVTKKYGINKDQLDELNIPHVRATNPMSKNFHDMLLYYDSLVKRNLELRQVPQYLRYKLLREALVSQGIAEGLHMLYGKVYSRYIKDQGVELEGMIRHLQARISRSKAAVVQVKKGRKPPRDRVSAT